MKLKRERERGAPGRGLEGERKGESIRSRGRTRNETGIKGESRGRRGRGGETAQNGVVIVGVGVGNGEEGGVSVVEGGPGRESAVFDQLSADGGMGEEETGGEEVSVELLDVGEGGASLNQRI